MAPFVLPGAALCPLLVCRYAKQQPAALDKQLPRALRAQQLLPPAPQLCWQPSHNLLHPLQQQAREVYGGRDAAHPPSATHAQEVPFGE